MTRPGRLAFIWLIAFLAVFLLTLIPSRSEPTSKVTWEDRRGIPIAFIQINRYTGPCAPEEETCTRIRVGGFDPRALALDALASAALSGPGALIIHKLLESRNSHPA